MALRLDELEAVSKKLTFEPDYKRFRSVCKAWRSAAPERLPLPWLIASGRQCSKFYQFSFETNRFTEIPGVPRPSLLSSFVDHPHVIRSAHGWLFLLDLLTRSVSLVNPLTDSIINLPKFPALDFSGNKFGTKSVSVVNPVTGSIVDLPNPFFDPSGNKFDIKYSQFGFGLTSDPGELLPDCFALVYCSRRFFCCKAGSSVWNEMQHPGLHWRSDLHICCYNGKLFLCLGPDVFVCEFGDNPSICKLVSLGLNGCEYEWTRLVESDGDLLLVVAYDKLCRSCKVFKLELGQQQAKLVELKCFGDRTLLVGLDTTFSLLASKYPGCKKNSIYIPDFFSRYGTKSLIPGLFIYDCEEDNCQRFTEDDYAAERMIPCCWFRPSLLM